MRRYAKQTVISTIIREIDKGKILFDHPIQRLSGQWSLAQKSLLIDSILNDYPIPPIYVLDLENEGYTVADGKQRLTILNDYIKGNFKLSRFSDEVIVDGVHYELKNKFFHQLNEELQAKIKECELTIYHLKDYTEKEVEEIFYRLNNGTTLSKDQKIRIHMGSQLSQFIDDIINSELFTQKIAFTSGQIRKGENQTIVLQTLMLMSGYDYKDFSGKEIDKFALYFRNHYDEKLCKEMRDIIVRLNELIPEKNKMLKKINIPMIINGFSSVYKNKTKSKKYITALNKFFDEGDESYRKYCLKSTSNKENVEGRKNFFLHLI